MAGNLGGFRDVRPDAICFPVVVCHDSDRESFCSLTDVGSLFEGCLLRALVFECVIKQRPDEFSLVSETLQSSNFRQRLVLLGTDVGSCQLRSGLSLIRHVDKGVCAVTG